jgi:hypothetical protein
MDKNETYDDPSSVDAKDGKVQVDGPDAVDVTLTPEAAAESGERLIEGAAQAAGQRRLRGMPHQEQD